MSFRHLVAGLAAVTCACTGSPSNTLSDPTALIRGIEREGREGAYFENQSETFRLLVDETAVASVTWNASAGALNASGTRATWRLPLKGVATLGVLVVGRDGQEATGSWDFDVTSFEDNFATARNALLASPITVLDGGTSTTGSFCDIAYDSQSRVHLAYREDDHPAVHWALWNGSSWTVELADGMGFNTGGQVQTRFSLAIDSAGNPHLAYSLVGRGVWYATRTSTGWIRERVDSAVAQSSNTRISLALDPAQANRPTVAYQSTNTNGYQRIALAARTGANAWTNTQLNFPNASSLNSQVLNGDLLITSSGLHYFVYAYSTGDYFGTWDGTIAATNYVPPAGALGLVWGNAVFGATGRVLVRAPNAVHEITLSPFAVATSIVETSGSNVGDLAYAAGKPWTLHLHGSNLELVTTSTGNYWTYTQLGFASSSATPSLTVNPAGNASICYQSGGRILFQ